MTAKQAYKMLRAHALQLSEHFDSVQILASFPTSDGGTHGMAAGEGNWYARLGTAHEFIEKAKAEGLVEAIKEERE